MAKEAGGGTSKEFEVESVCLRVCACVCVIARTALKSFRMQVRVLVCVCVCVYNFKCLFNCVKCHLHCMQYTLTYKHSYTAVDVAFACAILAAKTFS